MSEASVSAAPERASRRDIGFAAGIVAILAVLFLPIPPALIDIGLALSIALSVLILMVALWIQKPLEFSFLLKAPALSATIEPRCAA